MVNLRPGTVIVSKNNRFTFLAADKTKANVVFDFKKLDAMANKFFKGFLESADGSYGSIAEYAYKTLGKASYNELTDEQKLAVEFAKFCEEGKDASYGNDKFKIMKAFLSSLLEEKTKISGKKISGIQAVDNFTVYEAKGTPGLYLKFEKDGNNAYYYDDRSSTKDHADGAVEKGQFDRWHGAVADGSTRRLSSSHAVLPVADVAAAKRAPREFGIVLQNIIDGLNDTKVRSAQKEKIIVIIRKLEKGLPISDSEKRSVKSFASKQSRYLKFKSEDIDKFLEGVDIEIYKMKLARASQLYAPASDEYKLSKLLLDNPGIKTIADLKKQVKGGGLESLATTRSRGLNGKVGLGQLRLGLKFDVVSINLLVNAKSGEAKKYSDKAVEKQRKLVGSVNDWDSSEKPITQEDLPSKQFEKSKLDPDIKNNLKSKGIKFTGTDAEDAELFDIISRILYGKDAGTISSSGSTRKKTKEVVRRDDGYSGPHFIGSGSGTVAGVARETLEWVDGQGLNRGTFKVLIENYFLGRPGEHGNAVAEFKDEVERKQQYALLQEFLGNPSVKQAFTSGQYNAEDLTKWFTNYLNNTIAPRDLSSIQKAFFVKEKNGVKARDDYGPDGAFDLVVKSRISEDSIAARIRDPKLKQEDGEIEDVKDKFLDKMIKNGTITLEDIKEFSQEVEIKKSKKSKKADEAGKTDKDGKADEAGEDEEPEKEWRIKDRAGLAQRIADRLNKKVEKFNEEQAETHDADLDLVKELDDLKLVHKIYRPRLLNGPESIESMIKTFVNTLEAYNKAINDDKNPTIFLNPADTVEGQATKYLSNSPLRRQPNSVYGKAINNILTERQAAMNLDPDALFPGKD